MNVDVSVGDIRAMRIPGDTNQLSPSACARRCEDVPNPAGGQARHVWIYDDGVGVAGGWMKSSRRAFTTSSTTKLFT